MRLSAGAQRLALIDRTKGLPLERHRRITAQAQAELRRLGDIPDDVRQMQHLRCWAVGIISGIELSVEALSRGAISAARFIRQTEAKSHQVADG